MKRFFVIVLLILPSVLLGQSSQTGLGIIIGMPTGLSGKLLIARNSAIAVHAGWSILGDQGLHITGDYQFLFPGVVKQDGSPMEDVIPYFGLGGRFRFKKKENEDTKFHLGFRFGGGIEYLVSQFGIFLELYPVLDVVPKTAIDFEGGIGGRYYF